VRKYYAFLAFLGLIPSREERVKRAVRFLSEAFSYLVAARAGTLSLVTALALYESAMADARSLIKTV